MMSMSPGSVQIFCASIRVVFLVRADKVDVYDAIRIVDPGHEPVPVARKIEDDQTVAQDAGSADVGLQIGRRRPVRGERQPISGKARSLCVRMDLPGCRQCREGAISIGRARGRS